MGFAMITNASFPSSGLFLAYQHDLPKLKMDVQHLIRHARAFADHLKTSFSIGIAASILAWGVLEFHEVGPPGLRSPWHPQLASTMLKDQC